ncbi:MAG: valine--tRNA ligase [Defluviitaleaceae bacterium]|nr:valine--tRNA ligase [Defluviitaleaceae bacterium]
MEKNFEPKKSEKKIYENWIEKDYFHADSNSEKESFTISMPPPNITGELHMGHALNLTLQDILTRFKRMQGYNTLWLPGTDHASISTELKIVDSLKKEGKTKQDLGRDKFLKRAWEWKEKYGSLIVNQCKSLGISTDWNRENFTMSKELSLAVETSFINLYKKGYIYKGEKLINWCPKCKTTISDAEVEHLENNAKIYYLKYSVAGTKDFLTFATTRPETLLGDTSLAVNPKDERYKKYIGKKAIIPFINREIPILSDEYVDMEFGTGVVKITPAHDFNDYEIGIKHGLPMINILNDDATINENGKTYSGLDRYIAREKILQDFKSINQFVLEKDLQNSIGVHEKCETILEPLLKTQWFVKMKDFVKPCIDAYESGNLNFYPQRFSKIYLNWLENIHDWCISRQLWWGHRIPAYYCECSHITVGTNITDCEKCNSKNIKQDEDVLDTWFSSALWPFSTLGWPEQTQDLKTFFPTNVLVTGPDIIFFWVVRMVFSSIEHTGKLPFKDVILNGIVRDENGRKMSKSLGNGINPLEIIEKYGTDSLRLTLVIGSSLGMDQRFYIEKVEANRNFLNKIWNAARFIEMNQDKNLEFDISKTDFSIFEKFSTVDKWILNKFNNLVKEITTNIENYDFGMAIGKIYDFTWNEYCDWYIEISKQNLKNENLKENTLYTLKYILINILKVLHPYVPFITEEIFINIQKVEPTIVLSSWPKIQNYNFEKEEQIIENIKDIIKKIRNIRHDMNVEQSKKISITFVLENNFSIFEDSKEYFKSLAGANRINIIDIKNNKNIDKNAVEIQIESGFVYLENLVDIEKEIQRLQKEKQNIIKELDRATKMLNNPEFLSKAKEFLIEKEKAKIINFNDLLNKINYRLDTYLETEND